MSNVLTNFLKRAVKKLEIVDCCQVDVIVAYAKIQRLTDGHASPQMRWRLTLDQRISIENLVTGAETSDKQPLAQHDASQSTALVTLIDWLFLKLI